LKFPGPIRLLLIDDEEAYVQVLAKRLGKRNIQVTPANMPVIMLTGHGSETAAREGLELGAFDYLTKPCDFEELARKIVEACGKGGDRG